MIPIFTSRPLRCTVRMALCEACASSETRLRVNSTTFCADPGAAPAGSSCRRTSVPPGPRIFCTTSSRRQPMTSVSSPVLPSPTAVMRSLAESLPEIAAGPPAITSITVT